MSTSLKRLGVVIVAFYFVGCGKGGDNPSAPLSPVDSTPQFEYSGSFRRIASLTTGAKWCDDNGLNCSYVLNGSLPQYFGAPGNFVKPACNGHALLGGFTFDPTGSQATQVLGFNFAGVTHLPDQAISFDGNLITFPGYTETIQIVDHNDGTAGVVFAPGCAIEFTY